MHEARRQPREFDQSFLREAQKALEAVLEGLREEIEDSDFILQTESDKIMQQIGLESGEAEGLEAYLDSLEQMGETWNSEAHKRAIQKFVLTGEHLHRFVGWRGPDAWGRLRGKGGPNRHIETCVISEHGARLYLTDSIGGALLACGPDTARTFFVALLLWGAFKYHFGRYRPSDKHESGFEFDARDPQDDIAWQNVWSHYSALAELEAKRWESRADPIRSEQSDDARQVLGLLSRIDEKVRQLFEGQIAVIDRIFDMERASREILEAYEVASTRTKNSCETRVRQCLGEVFESLDARAQKFLVSAEWACVETPQDLDFSGAILLFMKTFEHELHKQLGPISGEIQKVFAGDLDSTKTTLEKLTLANWGKLLKKHEAEITPEFNRIGLELKSVRKAIEKVNSEVLAKHTEERQWDEAIRFRKMFLDQPSVLALLFPELGKRPNS